MKNRDVAIGAVAFAVGFIAIYLLMSFLLAPTKGIPNECPTMADMGGETDYGDIASIVYVGPTGKNGKQVCSMVFEYYIDPLKGCGKMSLYFEPGDKMLSSMECVTETQSEVCKNSCAGALNGAKSYIKQFI